MSTLKADSIQPTNNGNNLIFKTGVGDAERMRIDTSGNVGIGVSPSYNLHVSGTCAIVPNTNVGMRIYEDTDSANFLRFRPLSSTGSQTGFMFSGDDDSPHLTINYTSLAGGSPRIGIGTASPTVALDVNGDIKSSTYVRATSGMVIGGATFAAPTGTAPLFGVRAWGRIDPLSAQPVLTAGGNIASVSLADTGNFRITLTTPMPNTNYAVIASSFGQTVPFVDNRTGISTQIVSTNEIRLLLAQSNTDVQRNFYDGNQVFFIVVG